MRRLLAPVSASCLLAAIQSFVVPTASADPPPASAFARLPQISNVVLSPGSTMLAWANHDQPSPVIETFNLAKQQKGPSFSIPVDLILAGVAFADDDMLLLELNKVQSIDYDFERKYVAARVIALDLSTGKARVLLAAGHYISLHTKIPHEIVMTGYEYLVTAHKDAIGSRLAGGRSDSGLVPGIFGVDTRSGKFRKIAQGNQYTIDWVVDADGNAAARADWYPGERTYRVLTKDSAGWRVIYERSDGRDLALWGVSADHQGILATGAMNSDRYSKAWILPIDGSAPRVLSEDPDGDITGIEFDPHTGAPLSVYHVAPGQYQWLDARLEQRSELLGRSFPGQTLDISPAPVDATKVLLQTQSSSHPPVWYVVDLARKSATPVGDAYPELIDVPMGETQRIDYPSRDGATIPAYLTLPPGTADRNLPLIVLVHGGPATHDDDLEFNWWVQFLATRGYAVLQPQFRGSTGFGEAHRIAGERQWGKRMQDDVTDGVRKLISDGIADAKRICIVGASYGGYAALAGAAFTPDLYACAVSIAGVSDLPLMIGHTEKMSSDESNSLAYWRRHIGPPDDPDVIAYSPARAASNVRVPILLIHGLDDIVVPPVQSQTMVRAMQAAGKEALYVEVPEGDHWLTTSTMRERMLEESGRFIARYIGRPSQGQ
ncbi:MAG: alpha/beta fold hydrolase [Steroidobacteraceae bacterium]